MLQRFDISLDSAANRLSIREFAVIEQKPKKMENYELTQEDYALLHEVSFDVELIRDAIQEGPKALISEIRTEDFFPIGSCADILAEKVTGLFNGIDDSESEVFFDDQTLLSTFSGE
jgi:hypothetical protein